MAARNFKILKFSAARNFKNRGAQNGADKVEFQLNNVKIRR
ncbi:hypothetical protein CAMGR0001_2875 [Campylobacter gracilis RM3268]|uniref:Uncharacterized protein n=1 Tax=Campylobacter gracilis RM3268 TaxID=553220 RepID=C8PL84_9BACT|nr:hypothetical protein CAMGR0001_2875 [Campylobacter gracilis RM3268]